MGVRKQESVPNRQAASVLLRARDVLQSVSVAGLALLLVGSLGAQSAAQPIDPVRLISVNTSGNSGNGASNGVAVNIDASAAAFYSDATSLVNGDTNQVRDVFVRSLPSGPTERVSLSSTGAQANGPSHATGGAPAISDDGNIVAFYSQATNLVSNDTNDVSDVFVRVRNTGVTERVSVASGGTEANGGSVFPSISGDGRFVAFQSQASNLVAGDTNDAADIFVRDRTSGTTERVCGIQGNRFSFSPAISADGNVVAFASAATDFIRGDLNGHVDIYVCDRTTDVIDLVSVATDGTQGDGDSILPAISADGRFVGFKSLADNLVAGDNNNVVDVFVRDRVARTTERISVNLNGGDANDFSFPPSLSDDGRFVAFGSFGTNIVANDANHSSDVFVRDRQIGLTLLVDVNDQGEQANGSTPDVPPSVSGDGLHIGFVSFATNLAPNDRNEAADVFLAPNPFLGPNSCPEGTCPAGNVCVRGFCVTPTRTPTVTRTPTPTRTGTPTLTPTPTPTFRGCIDDTECRPDEHCRAGFCKKERPCDDADPTVDRLQCFDREACIGRLCECGGDCNVDGIVLVNEITKAILVLGGVVPIDQCTAADINGDGQVVGNEITLAVLNLSQGCVQEGQPLLFSHDRGGMVTLTVGSTTSSSGDNASVAVEMSGGEGEVATVQMDLLFDSEVLDIGDPTVSCVLDSRLAGEVFLATLPSQPPAPAGLQRLRLFIGDTSVPIATFSDGHLLSCAFWVKPGGTVTSSALMADQLNVGDARGDVFGSRAVNGGVSILLPTPTPAPVETPRPSCAGDCDGDGEVRGNEITVAVRAMAGLAPLTDCPAADADGDGEVLVTDVTRAVISLVRGCPR